MRIPFQTWMCYNNTKRTSWKRLLDWCWNCTPCLVHLLDCVGETRMVNGESCFQRWRNDSAPWCMIHVMNSSVTCKCPNPHSSRMHGCTNIHSRVTRGTNESCGSTLIESGTRVARASPPRSCELHAFEIPSPIGTRSTLRRNACLIKKVTWRITFVSWSIVQRRPDKEGHRVGDSKYPS